MFGLSFWDIPGVVLETSTYTALSGLIHIASSLENSQKAASSLLLFHLRVYCFGVWAYLGVTDPRLIYTATVRQPHGTIDCNTPIHYIFNWTSWSGRGKHGDT